MTGSTVRREKLASGDNPLASLLFLAGLFLLVRETYQGSTDCGQLMAELGVMRRALSGCTLAASSRLRRCGAAS